MTNPLERLFGANWRTSVTGIMEAIAGVLTVLAMLPYELGDLATKIDPNFKPMLVKIGLVSTFALVVINRLLGKDKSVTGNGTPQAPFLVDSGTPGLNRVVPPALSVIGVLFSSAVAMFVTLAVIFSAAVFLTGCQTTTAPDGTRTSQFDSKSFIEATGAGLGLWREYDRGQHPERYPDRPAVQTSTVVVP